MLTKEDLQERAQLVRIWESACKIEYPTPDEANFRIAIAKKLGQEFGLKEVRPLVVAGPVVSTPPRPSLAKPAKP
jgi:hypothetical protein